VATTDQPYAFTNDDPLNSEDPLGLIFSEILGAVISGLNEIANAEQSSYAPDPTSGPISLEWGDYTGGGPAQMADGYSGAGGPPAAGPGSEGTGGESESDDTASLSPAARKLLGNSLASRSDETVADVIRSRGGGASQINQLQTGIGQETLGSVAQEAVDGDEQAAKAIKMVKQAGTQGKGGK
jgi:hypothetical protein